MTVSTYADPAGVHDPSSGGVAPATWFSQLNTNFLAIRNRPCAKIKATTTQSLSVSSTATITLGTIEYDNSSLMSGTANTLTVPSSYAGVYAISAQCRVTSTPAAAHSLQLEVRKNGAQLYYEFIQRNAAAGSASTISMSFLASLAVADALTLVVITSANISAIATVVSAPSSLSAFWLSA